jgi:hypothetical protein
VKGKPEAEEGPALLIGVGDKPKPGEEEEGGDDEDMHIDSMFDALHDGDREAFREAFKKCLMADY